MAETLSIAPSETMQDIITDNLRALLDGPSKPEAINMTVAFGVVLANMMKPGRDYGVDVLHSESYAHDEL